MEPWNTGILGLFCIALKNIVMLEINPIMDRKNLDPNMATNRPASNYRTGANQCKHAY
jgi:hypothetical protein